MQEGDSRFEQREGTEEGRGRGTQQELKSHPPHEGDGLYPLPLQIVIFADLHAII